MPGYKALVDFISRGTTADPLVVGSVDTPGVIQRLQLAGVQVPEGFKILLGRQHIAENTSAPRIIFIPIDSQFRARAPANRSPAGNGRSNPSAEMRFQQESRSIKADWKGFEVRCWGQAEPPSADGEDYDATEILYSAVIQTVHALATGAYELGDGVWVDDAATLGAGKEYVFTLRLGTPILDTLSPPATVRAPSGTTIASGVYLQPADPTIPPELAATVTAP